MFNPIKAQRVESGHAIRFGNKLPADSVGLAYVHSPPLTPDENVHITDLSGFVLENVAGRGSGDEDLWPNDQGLLTSWNGSPQLQAKSFILTNEFKDGTPLYYAYDLTYPLMSRGRAHEAAAAVLVQDHLGEPLDAERKYKIVTVPATEANQYQVRVFTAFQVQPNEELRVVYTAFKDGRVIPGYTERLSPSLAYNRHDNLEDVILIPNRHLLYYQAEGKEVGESQIYAGSVPIRDLDHRVPVPFRYRLKARAVEGNADYVVMTPWVYESVFHPDALSAADVSYQNGHKRLHNKIAIDLIAEFGDITPFKNPKADVTFSVESSNPEVYSYTQSDGKNYILAYTEQPTGTIRLPDDHRVQNRSMNYSFQVAVTIDDEKPTLVSGSVSILDGHKKIAGPFEGKRIDVRLVRPYDPVNIYVKNDSLYVYTKETDVFYVPRFSMRTESDSQIRVVAPEESEPDANWYLRVRNGQFRRLSTEEGFHIDNYYGVPEYFRQGFDAEGVPFKKVVGETPRIIGEQRLRLRHKPLHIRKDKASGLYNLEVSQNGLPVNLIGWDAAEGTLDVDTRLSTSDDIVVSYFYEEHTFKYRGYYDKDNDRFHHLDLNPGSGHFFTDRNPETGEVQEQEGFRLINRTVYLYMRPTAMFTEAREIVRGSYQDSVLFHSFAEVDEAGLILLAKINVRPNASVENLTLVDVRKRGGGLKESVTPEQQQAAEPDSKHYWDIADWDGEAYPESGIFVVQLPTYLLKDRGGDYTKAEVETIVGQHLGYGVLPVIEYIDEAREVLAKPQGVNVKLIWKGDAL